MVSPVRIENKGVGTERGAFEEGNYGARRF